MSKSNSTASPSSLEALSSLDGNAARDLIQTKADALFRASSECCRQHRRYAVLVERGASTTEQRRALALVRLCDEHLVEATAMYEKAAARVEAQRTEEWYRCANALWHAAREVARRHEVSRRSARDLEQQDANTIGELALDYDLQASALLLLSQAVESYKKSRPEAEICPPKK
jgi:hypothetical protein